MLQLKNIKKDYKTAGLVVHALKGVDLNFRKNEFVSILGAGSVVCVLKIRIQGVLELPTLRPNIHWLLTTTQDVSRETF